MVADVAEGPPQLSQLSQPLLPGSSLGHELVVGGHLRAAENAMRLLAAVAFAGAIEFAMIPLALKLGYEGMIFTGYWLQIIGYAIIAVLKGYLLWMLLGFVHQYPVFKHVGAKLFQAYRLPVCDFELCWPRWLQIYVTTLPAYLEATATALALGAAANAWTEDAQRIWSSSWRTASSLVGSWELPTILLVLLWVGFIVHIFGFVRAVLKAFNALIPSMRSVSHGMSMDFSQEKVWTYTGQEYNDVHGLRFGDRVTESRLESGGSVPIDDKFLMELTASASVKGKVTFWFGLYSAADIANLLLVSDVVGEIMESLEEADMEKYVNEETVAGHADMYKHVKEHMSRQGLLGQVGKDDRSSRFVVKTLLGTMTKIWCKISLGGIFLNLLDLGLVDQATVDAAMLAIVFAALNLAQGFYQILPFIKFMVGLSHNGLLQFSERRRRGWFVLLTLAVVLAAANLVRFVGLFQCESHTFNFSSCGCVPVDVIHAELNRAKSRNISKAI